MSTDQLLHRQLTEAIIGSAMKVLTSLKPGLEEKSVVKRIVRP